MSRTILKYSAGLIALYLAVAYGTDFGKLIDQTTKGASTVVKSFQGR